MFRFIFEIKKLGSYFFLQLHIIIAKSSLPSELKLNTSRRSIIKTCLHGASMPPSPPLRFAPQSFTVQALNKKLILFAIFANVILVISQIVWP